MTDAHSESPLDRAAAYALDALDPAERRAFEAELARSPELQQEVQAFREANALLALQDETPPDPALKARLMERIGTDKAASLPTRSARPPMTPYLWAGLAATLLLTAGLWLKVRDLETVVAQRDSVLAVRDARLAERERTLNSILEPGVTLVPLTTTGDAPPGIQIFWDRDRNLAILHAFRLPPAPAGRTYQLWLLKDTGPVASQLFNSDPDGHVLVEGIAIPAETGIRGFAITEEPAAGSPQPTTPVLLLGQVAASD